jgi:protein gp37
MNLNNKIGWCDATWNVYHGCKNTCEFCYARKLAEGRLKGRFGYDNGFEPTFHQDRLQEPYRRKTPTKIFVSSMGDLFGCYDDQTEVLTSDGWKMFDDVTYHDRLACIDPSTNEMFYSNPTSLTKIPYIGKMYKVKAKSIDLVVTPNHKMFVSMQPSHHSNRKDTMKFELLRADSVYHKNMCYKRDFVWNGTNVDTFVLDGYSIPMTDWLEFMGYWISEGHVYMTKTGQCRVTVFQKTDGKYYAKMKACMEKIASCFDRKLNTDSEGRMTINHEILYKYMIQFGHSHEKFIPTWIKALPSDMLNILLESLMIGDGMVHKNIVSKSCSYFTVSKKLADDVHEIGLKCGFVASTSVREPRTYFNKRIGKEIRGNHSPYQIILGSVSRTPEINHHANHEHADTWIDYDGMIYCAEVPNHVLYVRRNGKSCWCGNSWMLPGKGDFGLDCINRILKVVDDNPQHTFQFLTKYPQNLRTLLDYQYDNMWVGTTVTCSNDRWRIDYLRSNVNCTKFVSFEPLLGDIYNPELDGMDWVIIGAETGNRSNKVAPSFVNISHITSEAKRGGIPVYHKDNLQPHVPGLYALQKNFPDVGSDNNV